MIVGIDCSATPSGGGRRHLNELLINFDANMHQFTAIKLWGDDIFLKSLPSYPWLIKKSHKYLNSNFFYKLIWRTYIRDRSLKNEIDILFSPFGTYIGNIKPYVSMSRNMLIFDNKERNRFFISKMWLKLNLLFFIQKKSFQKSNGIIFISEYAKTTISSSINIKKIPNVVINHGVSKNFDFAPRNQLSIGNYSKTNPFKILFLSSIWVYKHPINLLRAFEILLDKGYPIHLNIVGDNAQKKTGNALEKHINFLKKKKINNISWFKSVSLEDVRKYYIESDMFVFTSTCENMPNILIEAMATGLPIACSKYPPMPEFLKDAGVYFDPLNVNEIVIAIEKLILDSNLRAIISQKSYKLSSNFSWKNCADSTFNFLYTIANKTNV